MRVGCTNPFFLKMSNSAGAPFLKLAETQSEKIGATGRADFFARVHFPEYLERIFIYSDICVK